MAEKQEAQTFFPNTRLLPQLVHLYVKPNGESEDQWLPFYSLQEKGVKRISMEKWVGDAPEFFGAQGNGYYGP